MRITRRAVLAGSAMLAAPAIVRAQSPIQLKATHWLPPVHQIDKELTRWSEDLARRSGNRVAITVLPAGQMGPPQRQFDLARTGVADIGYFLPGLTPGRFPMADLFQLPFLFNREGQLDKPLKAADASAIATTVADDLGKQAEFEGTKILYSIVSPSGSLFMSKATVRKPDDLKGLRVRHNGPVGAANSPRGRDAGRGRAGRSRRRDGEGHDRRHDLQLRGRARLSDRQRCQKGDGAELGRERVHAGDQPRKA